MHYLPVFGRAAKPVTVRGLFRGLWFATSGNNLQIDVMGTTNQLTVPNWITAGGNQPLEITAGGLKLDGEVSQLVQAMATYSSGNPAFNPTAASQSPTDSALQGAIAAAWHH